MVVVCEGETDGALPEALAPKLKPLVLALEPSRVEDAEVASSPPVVDESPKLKPREVDEPPKLKPFELEFEEPPREPEGLGVTEPTAPAAPKVDAPVVGVVGAFNGWLEPIKERLGWKALPRR